MTYPLPVVDEIVTIGNPGHRAYKYRVQWKGDTVVRVDPDLNNARIGYSDLMKRNTTLYYNVDGPGNLYERGYLLGHDFKVQPANIKEDTATVDWYDLLKEK